MKLFLVHCGMYDEDTGQGIFESHTSLFTTAASAEDARMKIKESPTFKSKRMHIDGVLEIAVVDGHRVRLDFDQELQGRTLTDATHFRDLKPESRR